MHTMDSNGFTIHHHGDFSGDIEFVNQKTNEVAIIPFNVIRSVVAEAVRSERISKLEQATESELLGLEE